MVRNLAILRKINLSVQSEKSPFRQFDFWVNIIFRPENALTERTIQNNQSIRTNQSGRLITDLINKKIKL